MPRRRLTELYVEGFRGFGAGQTLALARPLGTPGSGLNVLVGPNNGGKSTVLEALRCFMNPDNVVSFSEGQRNRGAKQRVLMALSHETGDRHTIESAPTGGSEASLKSQGAAPRILGLPSRRHFQPRFTNHQQLSREQYARTFADPQRDRRIDVFVNRMGTLLTDAAKRKEFDSLLERVCGKAPQWTMERDDGGAYYVKFGSSDRPHSSDGLGQGLISLLIVVDALYDSNTDDVIAIDEPELSLHPALQRRLSEVFVEYSADRQIILATHSPYFVSLDALEAGGTLARVYFASDDACRIAQLRPDTAKSLLALRPEKDSHNPHVLGLDAKEVFFLEDAVIVVEGQEDVIGYRRMAAQLGTQFLGHFYGWGVGGADKMSRIMQLLRDLDFKRVVAVLDANKKSEADALRLQFPSYKILVLPTDDIRDRISKPRPPADGMLDQAFKLKTSFENQARELIRNINAALTG